MNIAAYCRVSTDKEDQQSSLEMQKNYFGDYAKKQGHNLVKLYADEGISGTKIKNRKQFQQLMKDAKLGIFELVVVKDISRFARNTVDFLQSVRTLKSYGINTIFLTANMESMGDSEFVLTLFSAIAQEESSNTSKRIKFSKKTNAEKGRVPNYVYGYDKIPGDYFNLSINEAEAAVVQEIFTNYTTSGNGVNKIADMLNDRGIKTKRGGNWNPNGVKRILQNEIYIGKIINGKEEVKDFLTGTRTQKDESDWLVTIRPELALIDKDVFEKAQSILSERVTSFTELHSRHSNKHNFSTLIKCSDCGYSFRRIIYKDKPRWVCSRRNIGGADKCPNATIVPEDKLISELQSYFSEILSDKETVLKNVVAEFNRIYRGRGENENSYAASKEKLKNLSAQKDKFTQMFVDDLMTREEVNAKIKPINNQIEQIKRDMKILEYNLSKSDIFENVLDKTFQTMSDITDVNCMTNAELSAIINKITVDKDGQIDIYLNLLNEIGLDKSILVNDNNT
jgi:DNA invertase Pin-like site-specific DNA recombinase